MKLLLISLISLVSTSSLEAAISISTADSRCDNVTTTCTFFQRETGPSPFAISFTVSGTGNLSLDTCTPSDPAFNNNPCPSGNGGFSLTFAGSAAPSTAKAYLNGYFNNSITALQPQLSWVQVIAGSNGCTTGCSWTFILNVVALTPPTFKAFSGSVSNCSNSSSVFFDSDTCTWPDGLTPGTTPFNNFPGIGTTITDSHFHGVVRQIAKSPPYWRSITADSLNSAVNASGTMVLTTSYSGTQYVTSATTGADLYTISTCQQVYWDSINPNIIYAMGSGCGLTIYKIILPNTTPIAIYSYPAGVNGNTQIGGGNDTQLSKDNWLCFTPDKDNNTILFNTNTLTSYKSPTWPNNAIMKFCQDPSCSGSDGVARHCQMSVGVNTSNNKRYVIQNWNGAGFDDFYELYSLTVGSSTIVDEGPLGGSNVRSGQDGYTSTCSSRAQFLAASCFGGANELSHPNFIEVAGIQYMVFSSDFQSTPYNGPWLFVGRVDMSANGGMVTSVEAGGGLYTVTPYGVQDMHVSAAKSAPYWVVGLDYDAQTNIPAYNILTASGTNTHPISISTDIAYPGANGDSILVNGSWCLPSTGNTPNTALNGTFTISGLPSALSLSGTTANCLFSRIAASNGGNPSGALIQNVAPTYASSPYTGELWGVDSTKIATKKFTITRIAKTRNWTINDQMQDSFYGGSHPGVSGDGTVAAWESNGGLPSTLGVFTAGTGYTPMLMGAGMSIKGRINVSGQAQIIH